MSCVTLTDGWFFKLADVNAQLKTVDQVVNQWLLPQNADHCTLIVNAPPDRAGRMAPNIVQRLQEIGAAWSHGEDAPSLGTDYRFPITARNLAQGIPIHASGAGDTTGPDQANDGDYSTTWWTPPGDTYGWLELDFPKPATFNTLVVTEPIGMFSDYQVTRIGKYVWEEWRDWRWVKLVDSSPGSNPVMVHKVKRMTASKLRFWFEVIQDTAHVTEITVFDEPERVFVPEDDDLKTDEIMEKSG